MKLYGEEATTLVTVRMPVDLKNWLEMRAARTLTSRSSEIVQTLRQRMDAEQKAAG
jgi:predicted transcriptional regulator